MLELLDSTDDDIQDLLDDEVFMIQEDSYSDSSSKEDYTLCLEPYLCVCQTITVLTKEKDFILEILDKVEDSIVRREYLIKL